MSNQKKTLPAGQLLGKIWLARPANAVIEPNCPTWLSKIIYKLSEIVRMAPDNLSSVFLHHEEDRRQITGPSGEPENRREWRITEINPAQMPLLRALIEDLHDSEVITVMSEWEQDETAILVTNVALEIYTAQVKGNPSQMLRDTLPVGCFVNTFREAKNYQPRIFWRKYLELLGLHLRVGLQPMEQIHPTTRFMWVLDRKDQSLTVFEVPLDAHNTDVCIII